MKELTKAEEQVMQYIWTLKKAYLKDIVEQFPEPKPAYTTVSTVIRVLVKKGFVSYNTYNKVHEYYPSVAKDIYFKKYLNGIAKTFFNGSTANLASFFAENEDLSLSELEKMRQLIDSKIDKLKENGD